MAQEDKIIIEVEVDAGESAENLAKVKNSIKDLKAEQKEINAAIRENGKVTDEQARRLANIGRDLKELTAQEKMYTAQIQIATQNDRKYGDSIIELGAQLAQLKLEYRSLSKQERESAAGKDMLKSIQALDHEVKQLDVSLGDNQRLVGDYTSAIFGVNGQVLKLANLFQGGFKQGIATAGAQLKAFGKAILTTPLGWFAAAAAAVVKIFDLLRDAFKRNDEAGTRLQVALERFRPIFDGIQRVLVNVVNWLSKGIDLSSRFANAILNMIPSYRKASEAAAAHVKELDDLEQAERDYSVASAERANERSKLEDEARNNEKLTTQQRVDNMKRALELERQDMEESRAIAKRKLDAAIEEAQRIGDTSDATQKKIADLRVAYINSETEFFNGTKKLQKQLQSFENQLDQEDKQRQQERQRRWKEAHQKKVEAARKAMEELRKLEDLQTAMIDDEMESQRKTIEQNYNRQIEDINKQLETEKNLTKEARQSLTEQVVLLQQMMYKELAAVDDEELKKANERLKKADEEAQQRLAEAVKKTKEEYEKESLSIANGIQQRLNEVYGNVVKESAVELDLAQQNYERLRTMDKETKDALFENEEQYKNAVLQAEAQIMQAREANQNALQSQAKEVADTMKTVNGALSDLFEAAAGDSEEYEKFKKAIAIADAAISLAQTIAAATAISVEGDPYTMAIRIAANVAAVTAQFAAVVKAIKAASVPSAPAFAQGGIVPGSNWTGDKVPARLNSGEMVITREQQKELYDAIVEGVMPSGFDYERMAAAFALAASKIPAPVLDYSEFVAYGRKVTMEREKLLEY